MMRPHAFVAMPYGRKPVTAEHSIDFDAVYTQILAPALERAGMEAFRADQERQAGDILVDMFQELLVADVVLADLTLPNPNVWYELGVRHALRQRGVVLVYGSGPGLEPTKAFDLYTVRKQRYALDAEGRPDPQRLDEAIEGLAEMVRETLRSATRRIVSPVYQLLPHLEQPQWKRLMLGGVNEFSERYGAWASRVELARQRRRPGDIMTLAEETPTRALAVEARRMAGDCLLRLECPSLALEQYEAALEIDPTDVAARQKEAICLGRLGRMEEARTHVQDLLRDAAHDAESASLGGRLGKQLWRARWRPRGDVGQVIEPAALQAAAAREDSLLADAIAPYRQAFEADPTHYYSGINALTLTLLRAHLGGPVAPEELRLLEGGVRWAVETARRRDPRSYWVRATQAELSLLLGDAAAVERDWRATTAAADGDWFALDASRQTLQMLRDLGLRSEFAELALRLVHEELDRVPAPARPRQTLLFSGHRIDEPDRRRPRFPPEMEAAVAQKIEEELIALDAGPQDLALCQAAAGGDLLFLEAALKRGVRCIVMLPFDEPEFIRRSMLPSAGGETWRRRWLDDVRPRLQPGDLRILPQDLGPTPDGVNAYERANRWLLNTALAAAGPERVRFLCLWDGRNGDGPGGTRHMLGVVERHTGQVRRIDPQTLVGWALASSQRPAA